MKTCTLKSVYESICRLRGWDPDTATVSASEKAVIADMINERMKTVWEQAFWPEIMVVEQRQYRATWDSTLNYSIGDEVYYDNGTVAGYYISLLNGNVNQNPVTATTYWELVGDDFLRTIDFQQSGYDEIGAVDLEDCIFDSDPRINPHVSALADISFYGEAIMVATDTAPYIPWLKYRPVTPEFSLTVWVAGTAYAIGDVCYLASSGSAYRALASSTGKDPESETAYWKPVDFPFFLKTFIKYAVHADWLIDLEAKGRMMARADEEMERLEDSLIDQQAVGRKARFIK